jgi:hypothetical protein
MEEGKMTAAAASPFNRQLRAPSSEEEEPEELEIVESKPKVTNNAGRKRLWNRIILDDTAFATDNESDGEEVVANVDDAGRNRMSKRTRVDDEDTEGTEATTMESEASATGVTMAEVVVTQEESDKGIYQKEVFVFSCMCSWLSLRI